LLIIKVGAIYHNLGNMETATGNLDEAIDNYQQATEIYMKHEAASQLALTDLCVGRLYLLQNKYQEARNMVARSEALFVRELGTERGFAAQYV
jgi:tetratricopeptide (TPR) repeat protein